MGAKKNIANMAYYKMGTVDCNNSIVWISGIQKVFQYQAESISIVMFLTISILYKIFGNRNVNRNKLEGLISAVSVTVMCGVWCWPLVQCHRLYTGQVFGNGMHDTKIRLQHKLCNISIKYRRLLLELDHMRQVWGFKSKY